MSPDPHNTKKTKGRYTIPANRQRRLVFGRIDPETETFLLALKAPNMGRAIDIAVNLLLGGEAQSSSSISR